jgi:hypothetical protein
METANKVEILKKQLNDDYTFIFSRCDGIYAFGIKEDDKDTYEYPFNFDRTDSFEEVLLTLDSVENIIKNGFNEDDWRCEIISVIYERLGEKKGLYKWVEEFYNEFVKKTATGSKTKPANRNNNYDWE